LSLSLLHGPRYRWSAEVLEARTPSGEAIIVKRARPDSRLARYAVRREARILEALSAAGYAHAPRFLRYEGEQLVMSRLDGHPLGRETLAGNELLFRRLVSVVEALHEAGFAHGELRSGNILVSRDGVALVDFATAVRRGHPLFAVLRQWDLLALHWISQHLFFVPSAPPRARWFDRWLLWAFAKDIPYE
jgi:RIO-like serine/threonine protein kinase